MTENEVEEGIIKFLLKKGWVIRRQHSALAKTMAGHALRLGEVGMCDWSAMRPTDHERMVEYCEIEAKATGAKPSKQQREYIAKRLHQNICATWADSVELFKRWYYLQGFE